MIAPPPAPRAAARPHWPERLALLLLHCGLALVLLRAVVRGERLLIAGQDGVWQTHGWLTQAWRSWQAGELPFWDFAVQSGTSFIGELQTAALYPVLIAFALVAEPGALAWSQAWVGLHFVLASLLMHLLLRSLGLSLAPCLVGALGYAYLGAVALRATSQPNLFASLVWLPAVLACWWQALTALRESPDPEPRRRLTPARGRALAWALGTGAVLATMVLAGHVHGFAHAVLALGLLTLMEPRRKLPPAIALLALAGLAALVAAAAQLAATRDYLEEAYKWHATGYTEWPHRVPLESMLGSGLRLADLPGLWQAGSRIRAPDGGTLFHGHSALALALIAVFGLLGKAGGRMPPVRRLWTLFALLAAAVALLLASIDSGTPARLVQALPLLGEIRQAARALHLYGFAVAVLAALGAQVLIDAVPRPGGKLVCAALLAALALFEAERFQRLYATPADSELTVAEAYHGSPLLDQLEGLSREHGQRYRYLSIPPDLFSPNLGYVRELRHALGYRSSWLRASRDYIERDWSLDGPVWQALGVRWLLVDRELDPDGFELLGGHDEIRLYERRDAVGVFWQPDDEGRPQPVAIDGLTWASNEVRLEVQLDSANRLVFAQIPYRGWKVEVDGQRRPLLKHEGLIAVELPAGRSRLRWYYDGSRYLRLWLGYPLVILAALGLAVTARRAGSP